MGIFKKKISGKELVDGDRTLIFAIARVNKISPKRLAKAFTEVRENREYGSSFALEGIKMIGKKIDNLTGVKDDKESR